MLIININVPESIINQNEKNKIVKYLSQAILKIEGFPNTKEARSLTWCFFNEIKNGAWAVGGESSNELKFYIQIYLFKKMLNKQKKKEIAKIVNKVLKDILKNKFNSNKSCILINEISDYNFCSGGKNIGVNELAKFLNIKLENFGL